MSLRSNSSHLRRSGPLAVLSGAVVTMLAALTVLAAATASAAQSSQVTIEKSTNGVDADAAPGPVVKPGSSVQWGYLVTVTGPTTLYDLIVSDSSGAVPNCDIDGDGGFDGTHIHPGPVEPGQSFSCGVTATAHGPENGTFSASGIVRAFDFDGAGPFEATDPSHYSPAAASDTAPAAPKVTIQSLVNGVDADATPGPYIAEGTTVVWTYVVTNTGSVALSSIVVSNAGGVAVDCGPGGNVIPGPLAPGASVTCTGTSPAAAAAAGIQTTAGSVLADGVDPTTGATLGRATAADPMNYTPVQLPGALAFTGPSNAFGFAIAGSTLALLGAALWRTGTRSGRRRQAVVEPAGP